MRSGSLLLLLSLAMGCTRPGTSSSPAASTGPVVAATTPQAAEPGEDAEAPKVEPGPWREAVRSMRWKEAQEQLDALPEADQKRPEIRLVRAKVAAMRKEPRRVVELTEGLELGLVGDLVARLRAEAALEVGPYEAAAAYYEKRPGSAAALKAGLAMERAGKLDEAKRQLDRSVSAAKGEKQEAAARTARARVLEAQGQREAAASDARWVFLRAPEHGQEAAGQVARLAPSWKATGPERMDRAERLAKAGMASEALAELTAAAQAPQAPTEAELLRARGMTLYKLRRYAEAAEVLDRSAKRSRSDDDAFHAARALSRANRDAEAIKAYQALAQDNARGPHADEATFLAARLTMLLGQYEEASRAYSSYLKRYRKGKFHQPAVYELGLVQVALRQYGKARATFGTLARSEDNQAEAARLRELEGAAALKAGDEAGAREAFVAVMKSQPLSWAAMASQARLAQMGVQAPVVLEPAGAGGPALQVQLPAAARLLHQLGLEEEAEAALREAERGLLGAHGARGHEALCEAYGKLDFATRRHRIGQDHVKLELVMREAGPANRWAWECLYPEPHRDVVRAVEEREGLPSGLVHAIMRQESAFDPDVVSPALAVGLMQLLPTTAREVAKRSGVAFEEGSLTQPEVNIDLGARYLSLLLKTWKGNLPLAIASYNAGPKAVSRWLEHAGGLDLDLWVARIPYAETRTYVGRVMGNLARYGYLGGGVEKIPRVTLSLDTSLRVDEGAF